MVMIEILKILRAIILNIINFKKKIRLRSIYLEIFIIISTSLIALKLYGTMFFIKNLLLTPWQWMFIYKSIIFLGN